MAANAQEEQQWIDGTHPALLGNSVPRSTSPTRSVSPTPSTTSSTSSSPRFDAQDPTPPPSQPAPLRKGGASNTGPKGVLADYAARQASTGGLGATNTGPKGVLSDWRGSQAASAEEALRNLSLGFVSSNGTVVRLDQEEDPLSEDEEEEVGGEGEEQARERYRAKRLRELKGSGERGGVSGPGVRRRHFGHLREIGMDQFLSAVEDEEEDVAVVLHLYEPEIEACAVLNQHLSSIARSYPQTKFIRALATEVDFSADMEEDTLPTMLVYRGGDLETTLVRPDLEWGRGTRADSGQGMASAEEQSSYSTTASPSNPLHSPATTDSSSSSAPDPEPSPSSNGGTLSPLSTDEPPRRLRAPHRRNNAPPLKSILKHPPPRQSGFSFRRDWIAYAAATAGVATTTTSSQGGGGAAGLQNAAAGFWGSALKKLSGVTAVAAGVGVQPQPARRELGGDEATTTVAGGSSAEGAEGSNSEKEGGASVAGSAAALASYEAAAHSRSTALSSSASASTTSSSTTPAAAPHQPPARGSSTSSPPAASPYATIKATVSPSTAPPAPPPLSVAELKRVRFRMASLKVVYPINGPNGPLAPWEEAITKKRINMEHRALAHKSLEGGESKGWTGEALSRLYAECCRTREEKGIERVKRAFKDNPRTPPKVLDLSNELLSHGAVEALADLLSVDWGLKKLVLESCGLDDESLRPLLHALLVSGSIPTVSLANNKRIKAKGWKLIAVFVRKARFLRYLDVSENTIDKRTADHLVQALTPHLAPPPPTSGAEEVESEEPSKEKEKEKIEGEVEEGDESEVEDPEPLFTVAPLLKRDDEAPEAATVLSIRLENCGLKGQALEALAHGVRASSLKHISIRRNRINPLGAVALAIMIRDYPLPTDAHHDPSPLHPSTPPLPRPNGALPSPSLAQSQSQSQSANSVSARQSLQAPYVRKSLPSSRSNSPTPAPTSEENGKGGGGGEAAEKEREQWRNSEARNKLRRQIEELPRTGSLLTLDVKGNDIRNGVLYIAQVLKRNRTLKVLNLSENKIDMQGLVSIAEALKFNSTLETLDMSLNPCCGPGLEGITSLRSAITINSNLKRVFLNSTDLSSEGAIALAEFLPEATSLIHLDLTGNFDIDIAGVLALSVSVKMNDTLRCLDLNIPPNDPDFARLSQEILQCCIRNTEQAQEEATSGGKKITIAAPILKSAVARDLKSRQEAQDRHARQIAAQNQSKDEILAAAEEVKEVLGDMLKLDEGAKEMGVIVQPSEVVRDALVQAQLAEAQLAEAVAATRQGDQKDRALVLGDQLTSLLDRAKALYEPPSSSSPSLSSPAPKSAPNGSASPSLQIPSSPIPASPADSPSSPGFTIADSDDDSDSDNSRPSSPSPTSPSADPKAPSLSISTTAEAEADDEAGAGAGEPDSDLSPRSPMESQSRSLTLEEGEVFRKGAALGTGEVDEDEEGEGGLGDVSGEELRKEILETPIARSPRPSFSGEASRPVVEPLEDGEEAKEETVEDDE
ncbi:hypothetical protein BCR35DRAFT_317717 [Leucosporidium creatinivorum]|uniref:Phosducin domain-containing protein n=1 Tax=Leucosporidium creatinivorum TaxID=106004 RepID=A0A1Y2FTV9_9BASI|nr:hypothetical protein BCR35DRAFT_317717 [Leucosporidium creatinivorum]